MVNNPTKDRAVRGKECKNRTFLEHIDNVQYQKEVQAWIFASVMSTSNAVKHDVMCQWLLRCAPSWLLASSHLSMILAEERRRRSGAYLMIHPRSMDSRWCNTLENRAIFSLCGEPRGQLWNSIFLLFGDTGPISCFFHCLSPQRWPELCHLLKMLYGVRIRRVS